MSTEKVEARSFEPLSEGIDKKSLAIGLFPSALILALVYFDPVFAGVLGAFYSAHAVWIGEKESALTRSTLNLTWKLLRAAEQG